MHFNGSVLSQSSVLSSGRDSAAKRVSFVVNDRTPIPDSGPTRSVSLPDNFSNETEIETPRRKSMKESTVEKGRLLNSILHRSITGSTIKNNYSDPQPTSKKSMRKKFASSLSTISSGWQSTRGVSESLNSHNAMKNSHSLDNISDMSLRGTLPDDSADFSLQGGVDDIAIESSQRRKSTRRDCVDANTLTMGLDIESANFLDFITQAKCEEWLKSLCGRDPRFCIKAFFDDVARDGADHIEEEGGFQPELLSPILALIQRSSVFSVWRPTSVESIRKMITGQGTGKGLDIKGKSAKKGRLSAYVPFMQLHEDNHKTKIRPLPRDGRIRIFYKKREARDKAHSYLSGVLVDMVEAIDSAKLEMTNTYNLPEKQPAQDEDMKNPILISIMKSLSGREMFDNEIERIINEWEMHDPYISIIDDYSPKCFGLDLPKRLFWEGYVMQAKDISREPGSMYDTGRPSRPSFQDMNFASIKNECEDGMPRAVVWQYTDPYLPPNEPDPDPMMPQTLLMAYEENGRVMPVVSDFDCFLLGTRGVRFHNPLPEEQVALVHEMLNGVESILKDCKEGKTTNWTASWLDYLKHSKHHINMPKYGFGDPKSYAIMKHAVMRLEEVGAVRHGAGMHLIALMQFCLFVLV